MNSLLQRYGYGSVAAKYYIFIIIGVVLALFLVNTPLIYTPVLIIGTIALAVVAKKPEIGILFLIVMISSIIFEDSLPLVAIGVGSLHMTDILLVLMLCAIVYKKVVNGNGAETNTPLDMPIILFIVTVLISVVTSLTRYGTDYNLVMRSFRHIFYYLSFFLVTNFINERKQVIFLIKSLFVVATIVAITMLAQAMVGDSIRLIPGRVETASTFEQEYGATRIIPPGQTLILVIFITSVCLNIFKTNKSILLTRNFYIMNVLGVGILLTYNRNTWIGVSMALCYLIFIIPVENKKRLIMILTLSAVLISALVIIKENYRGGAGGMSEALSGRFSSLFAGEKLIQSSQVQDRLEENTYALGQIIKHPILGMGLNTEYRPDIYGKGDELSYFVHNNYLWLLKDMGLTGFVFFMWFYIGFIIRALKNWKRIRDNYLRSVMLGFLLSGVAMLFMALVDPVFKYWFSIVVIAIIAGLSEVIIRINAKEMDSA